MTAGKGDTRRPAAVTDAEFAERWRRAFGAAVSEVAHNNSVAARKECTCAQRTLRRDVWDAEAARLDAELMRLANDDGA